MCNPRNYPPIVLHLDFPLPTSITKWGPILFVTIAPTFVSQKNDFTQPLFLAVICKEIADHKEPHAGKKSEKKRGRIGASWRRQLCLVSPPPNTPHPRPTSNPHPPATHPATHTHPHTPPTPTHPLAPTLPPPHTHTHTHSQCYLWHQLTVVNFVIIYSKDYVERGHSFVLYFVRQAMLCTFSIRADIDMLFWFTENVSASSVKKANRQLRLLSCLLLGLIFVPCFVMKIRRLRKNGR